MINFDKLSEYKENNTLEVKKASNGLPSSIWETYSAFANTSGGIILLGVSEDEKKQFITTGIQNADELIKDFWNTINNPQKVNLNILSEKNVYKKIIDSTEIVVIEVPRANRQDKPIYINKTLFGGTFRRNADGDYHCTEFEVKTMLRDQSDTSPDGLILENLTPEILNIDSITRYRNRFRTFKPDHVWNSLSNEEFLIKIGAAKRNEHNSKICPTVAGLLFFADYSEIINEFPDYFLDYRERTDETTRWIDRVASNTGDWSGNIFDFYFKVVGRLTENVKVPFKLKNGLDRIDDTDIHKALREALANSLIHADYYGRRGIVVDKFKTEISLSNPGVMRISIEEAIDGGISDARNPRIFNMFSLIEVGERSGMGLCDIYNTWNQYSFEAPEISEIYNPDRTIVKLKIESTKKNNVGVNTENVGVNTENVGVNTENVGVNTENVGVNTENVGVNTENVGVNTENVGVNSENVGVNYAEENVYRLLAANPYMKTVEIASALSITKRQAERIIKSLKDKGILKRLGSDKKGHWEVL